MIQIRKQFKDEVGDRIIEAGKLHGVEITNLNGDFVVDDKYCNYIMVFQFPYLFLMQPSSVVFFNFLRGYLSSLGHEFEIVTYDSYCKKELSVEVHFNFK